MSGPADTRLLSVREAAAMVGVNERTIRRAITRGDLPATKHAGSYRIQRLDVVAHAARRGDRPNPISPVADQPSRTAAPVILTSPGTALFGRTEEVAEACWLLLRPDIRLLTLTGPGGVGKTRLALEVAASLVAEFADGIMLVSLAEIRDPSRILPAMARSLGVVELPGQPLIDSMLEYLGNRQVLLVLDNCEQVATEVAREVRALLGGAPRLKVLATSQTLLRIAAEQAFPLQPFASPGTDLSFAGLADHPAVRLFVSRAQGVHPAFTLTPGNAQAVADICARLDGLPLALELAAAWVRVFPPVALLVRLERPLSLLIGGTDDLLERQRTMRQTIAWSDELLDPTVRDLFHRLSVFVGGFTLEAAEAVACDDALGGVVALVDRSLVRRIDTVDGEPRFVMLETIREYGTEQLVVHGEDAAVRSAHAAYYLALAEAAEPNLVAGAMLLPWLDRLDAELPNFRAALSWYGEQGDVESWVRLASALGQFWLGRSHLQEGRDWMERALARGMRLSPPLRARGLAVLAELAVYQIDPRAMDIYEEAYDLAAATDDVPCQFAVRMGQTIAALIHDDLDGARRWADAGVALTRTFPERFGGHQARTARGVRGLVAAYRQELDLAEDLLRGCLEDEKLEDDGAFPALANKGLGLVAWARGDHAAALALFQRSLAWYARSGDRWQVIYCLGQIAIILPPTSAQATVELLGTCAKLRAQIGIRQPEQAAHAADEAVASARGVLGEAAFAAAWDAGEAQSVDEAVATALSLEIPPELPEPLNAHPLLTAREIDVLRLVAEGQSDKEIAAALGITYRTTTTYMTAILTKLNVTSRTAAATQALRLGLV